MAQKTGDEIWAMVDMLLEHARTSLLYGPSGTGKSYAGHSQIGLKSRKVYSVTLTEDTAAVELRGHYVLAGSGEYRWQDGPALKAWREGARLVINELNHAGPDVTSFLLNCLDSKETARLTLPNGETLRPHPNFQAVATMNGEPDDLLTALRDRFPARLKITAPNPQGIARLSPDLRKAAQGTVCADDPNRQISLRTWLAFDEFRPKMGAETAAYVVFGERGREILTSLSIAR